MGVRHGLGAQGTAPQSLSLTPDDAVEMALRNNLDLKRIGLKVEETKPDMDTNRNVFALKISLSAALSLGVIFFLDRF